MIPVRDNLNCKNFPLATVCIIVANCLVFLYQLSLNNEQIWRFFMHWAVIPARVSLAFQSGDWMAIGAAVTTIFTAMFLHGSVAHILGNMIFLQAFGRGVENRLGTARFVLFYLVCGFAAWALHFAIEPMSMIPALGASGAIAGVLGAYLWFYTKASFRAIVPMGIFPILVTVKAYWLLPVWFLSQLMAGVFGLLSPEAGGGVAYWAHIGGFVGGFLIAVYWAWRDPQCDSCYLPITKKWELMGRKTVKKLFAGPSK